MSTLDAPTWAGRRLAVANHHTGHGPDCPGCLDPVTWSWVAHVQAGHARPVVPAIEPPEEFTGTLFG